MIGLVIVRDYEQMSLFGGRWLLERLRDDAVKTLGLATGSSPVGVYDYLVEHQSEWDASTHLSFNLDEYVGLAGERVEDRRMHAESYERFMREKLFDRLRPGLKDWYLPRAVEIDQGKLEEALAEGGFTWLGSGAGKAVSIDESAEGYLKWIKEDVLDGYVRRIEKVGGIDVQILGVGEDGHVGFHEAGIPLSEEMLLVKLDESTVENAVEDGHFESVEMAPRFAVSMGAGLAFRARQILLLASGERKVEIMRKCLVDGFDENVPVSGIWNYAGECVVVIDEVVARGLEGRWEELRERGLRVEDVR